MSEGVKRFKTEDDGFEKVLEIESVQPALVKPKK